MLLNVFLDPSKHSHPSVIAQSSVSIILQAHSTTGNCDLRFGESVIVPIFGALYVNGSFYSPLKLESLRNKNLFR